MYTNPIQIKAKALAKATLAADADLSAISRSMATDDTPDVFALYTQERKAGFGSKEALRRARTIAAWERMDGYFEFTATPDDGPYTHTPTVRLIISDDPEGYDYGYLDTCGDLTHAERIQVKNEIRKRIEFRGVVMVCAEWWNGEEWEHADSWSGLIGDEWQGSGLDVDLMQAAMDAYHHPLYIVNIVGGFYEISKDRETILATASGFFSDDPRDHVSTLAPARLGDYAHIHEGVYRKTD